MFVMDCYGHKLSNGVLFAHHLILDVPGGSSHLGYRRRVPPGHNPPKAIMMVVACTVSTKSSSTHKKLILFIDAIKAWYLLSTLARCRGRHLDRDAADGSLRARGWLTLCERLIVIHWVAPAAGEAKVLMSCPARAPRTGLYLLVHI